MLAPGAFGSREGIRPHVEGLRLRGFEAEAIELPRGRAEAAVGAFLEAARPGHEVIAGGHSFGGRVASLAAAQAGFAGLVCFGYPLHPPGRFAEVYSRSSHWPRISCPALLLSGESDEFARIDLLRAALPLLERATLVAYPGCGHGLDGVLEQALDEAARFVSTLTAR